MKRIAAISVFFAAILICSCTKDKGSLPGGIILSGCDSLNVTYSAVIKPIINTKCAIAGCHVSTFASANYTSYAGVKEKVDNGSFNNRVFVKGDMPLSGSLSDDERKKIKCWLEAGAPDN